jgi:hypothetical protein
LQKARIEAVSLKLAPKVWVIFGLSWGTMTMLSVDQFLRLISLPAVVAAFLIASQISGAGIFHPAHALIARQ